MFKLTKVLKKLVFIGAFSNALVFPVFAEPSDSVEPVQASSVRANRPVVWSVDLGFPKGLGVSALYNIQPEWALGATASHVFLWPTVGVFGRYFLAPQKPVSPFAEWRLYGHPTVGKDSYLVAPYVSTHFLYGWETRNSEGYYSHFALGLGIGNSTNEDLLLGFINFEFSFGGSIAASDV